MIILHSNDSFLLASFDPQNKRGNREDGCKIGHSHLNENAVIWIEHRCKTAHNWNYPTAMRLIHLLVVVALATASAAEKEATTEKEVSASTTTSTTTLKSEDPFDILDADYDIPEFTPEQKAWMSFGCWIETSSPFRLKVSKALSKIQPQFVRLIWFPFLCRILYKIHVRMGLERHFAIKWCWEMGL